MQALSGWVKRWAALGLILMLGAATFAIPQQTYAATVQADTLQVPSGGDLIVRASGFGHREHVVSWVSGVRGEVYMTARGWADGSGNIVLSVHMDRFWNADWWAITLQGDSTGRKAITQFQIIPSPPDGPLDISTTTASPGERINLHGSRFSPAEAVQAWVTDPNGLTYAIDKKIDSRQGEIWFSYLVPLNATPGTWYVTAYGLSTQRLLVSSFTVLP